jgi:glycosyltransferase involved in cell wall biosynthesis
MRITFLLPLYGWHPSGGFIVVYTYASLLAERGHDVSVIHSRRPPPDYPEPVGLPAQLRRWAGAVRDRIARPSHAYARIHPRVVMRYVPDLTTPYVPDADAVIATSWSTAEAALAMPATTGVRHHLIQDYETWYGAVERVNDVWRSPLYKIFIARWLRARALELGVSERMTTVIPNAVCAVFRIGRPIGARPRRVSMLYSSAPHKGGSAGLEILRRAHSEVPDLEAVLFGAEPAPRRLPAWITYLRSAKAAQLASDVYNQSAVYLCPSLIEGWHLPATEAMACGCAVVSSDNFGVREYATDGETALLYPPGDVGAGARALVAILLDDHRRHALAEKGAARVATLSWERNADTLAAVLERNVAADRNSRLRPR